MAGASASTQAEFYVSRAGQSQGPWSIQEIVALLGRSEVAATDFIFDEASGDWVAILEYGPVMEALRAAKPKAPPPPKKAEPRIPEPDAPQAVVKPVTPALDTINPNDAVGTADWYVQRGPQRFGPFTFLGIVRALQEKSISLGDLVWREGMAEWMPINEHSDFESGKIRALAISVKEGDIFFRRRYPRMDFGGEVLVHDNRRVWLAESYQAGEGGSGLIIENAKLKMGQVVNLHFASRDGLPAFNALCEIVSKRAHGNDARRRGFRGPANYGVKFLKIEPSAEEKVRGYFRERATG